ncbi:MAG: hypothetical protein K5978_06460 [Campylobacter sp.]|nr:hypothetical protein [Campylobacter sp.]
MITQTIKFDNFKPNLIKEKIHRVAKIQIKFDKFKTKFDKFKSKFDKSKIKFDDFYPKLRC